jgi:hypothetical protein
MENIPNAVLELMQQKKFNTLTQSEQQLVLKYFCQLEYDTYHQTQQLLFAHKDPFPSINLTQKNKLIQRFISSNNKVLPLWNTPIQFWKAASIFVLLGSGWLIHWQSYKQQKVEYITQLDTVFLEKEIPVKIYDTVYYKETNNYTETSNKKRNKATPERIEKESVEKGNVQPYRKEKLRKEDSLIQILNL